MKKKQEHSKLKKFLTIINPRTILGKCIILGTIIVLCVLIWFVTVSVISFNAFRNTTADKMAFLDDSSVDLTDVVRVNDEDLSEFYVYLECSSYDSKESKKATFIAYFYENKEETTELAGKMTTKLLVTADYMYDENNTSKENTFYSTASGTTVTGFATDLQTAKNSSKYYKKFSITDLVSLPSKTNTITLWPYSLKEVKTPIIYLYVSYTVKSTNKTHNYIIRFEFDDVDFTGVVK